MLYVLAQGNVEWKQFKINKNEDHALLRLHDPHFYDC